MEAELAIKWSQQGLFFAACVLGKLSRLKALQRREGENAGKDTCLQSNEYTSATQCAATLQGKRPLQKGTDVYQEQENFWRDWKLHNNKIDLLSSDKVGFRTDGSEMSADYWTRKGAR